MVQSARQTLQPEAPARVRREELIRQPDVRREFPVREAQRRLREKERSWAPIAYSVFLLAAAIIFCSAYTTYAFSKYRGVILPGVYVDTVSLAGMTDTQANRAILDQLGAIYHRPVTIVYHAWTWQPKDTEIGVTYEVAPTVREAEAVGRSGSMFADLVNRLPVHPDHHVPLLYQLQENALRGYLQTAGQRIYKKETDAGLQVSGNHVVLLPSERGVQVDIGGSEHAIREALGYLTRQTVTLQVDHIAPVISDEAALKIRDRVEAFLSRPPVVNIGKLKIVTSRSDFAPMLHFSEKRSNTGATIQMNVAEGALHSYVAKLAAGYDRPAVNAKLDFSLGRVRVVARRHAGRRLDQAAAFNALAAAITSLKPGAHLTFQARTVQPPTDLSNPASVGINTLLATGETDFTGSGPARLNDIALIAKEIDGDLLPPGQDISFNTLAGTNWDPRVYQDQESQSGGRVVPGAGGAMQQVATTFLRALYGAGLPLKQRYAHTYRLPWYEPPVGLDAVVAPDRGWDLVFGNDTGKYLLIKTRLEPVRQQLYIYVYGPKLGRSVAVDPLGKILKTYPHGPKIVKDDPALPPGEERQTQWAHDGADTVVQRTITYPNGQVKVDTVRTHYRPWHAIVLLGTGAQASPPSASRGKNGTPGPVPTPTFNH